MVFDMKPLEFRRFGTIVLSEGDGFIAAKAVSLERAESVLLGYNRCDVDDFVEQLLAALPGPVTKYRFVLAAYDYDRVRYLYENAFRRHNITLIKCNLYDKYNPAIVNADFGIGTMLDNIGRDPQHYRPLYSPPERTAHVSDSVHVGF